MNDLQEAILRFVRQYCAHDAGYCTADIAGHIARQPNALTARQHSAAILRELRTLEALSYVRRLDDKKPIVWCKV